MLRFLYFTLASSATAWGLLGWASHFLMPARTLYPACVVVGVLGGLIGALALSKRNQVRLFLLAFWPIGVVTIFFAVVGMFDFSELSFAELLNFEFAFMWCGALWAFIVLKPRRSTVFDEKRATLPSFARKPLYAQANRQSYFIPDQASLADAERAFVEASQLEFDERTEAEPIPDGDGSDWVPLDAALSAPVDASSEDDASNYGRKGPVRNRKDSRNEMPSLDDAVDIE